VRQQPGFDRFLKPKTLSQLAASARRGPVVVLNISSIRCDALILMPNLDDVLHLALPTFTYERAQKLQVSLSRILSGNNNRSTSDRRLCRETPRDINAEFDWILSELWRHVVRPVLDIMAFGTPPTELPRIWWCPTGPLTFLPIHAAGLYNTTEPGSKLSDFAISSYTPTLNALIDDLPGTAQQKFQLLAVVQPSTPKAMPLPCTWEELKHIQKHAGSSVVSPLVEADATVERVLRGMKESSWVHFACHGVQDVAQPTESGLILEGESRLKLSDIIKLSIPHASLAFLSACQTATGAKDLSEEAVHLAAGMLLAGYRGVIATMWSIADNDAPRVADDVYSHLFKGEQRDHAQAAYALHHAVQRLRTEGKPFLSWVPFIHIGA